MCLIYRCLSSASTVLRSWFIYELQKSTTIAFSRNSLYTFYSRNPTCGIPPCLRISHRKYPPCPQNFIIVNPPSPSEILKAVRGMVWIFSGIAQSCYHGKVISRFSQLFVGDKDNIFHFYLRTVYSHNVQLSALLIFLFLKRLFHFAGFTDHDYLFKVNAQ